MTVGVPEHEVFAAADAVLAQGHRPTVERVRAQLGRGSPARVGSLLDQWWGQLSKRLSGETRLPGLPGEVAQAFITVWQQAVTLAQGVAEQSMATQRAVLDQEREKLAEREARARLEVTQARQQTTEAKSRQQAAETRLEDLERLLEERNGQIHDLQDQRNALVNQNKDKALLLEQLQQKLEASQLQAKEARAHQDQVLRETEDRLFKEVDRARSQCKVLEGRLNTASQRAQSAQQSLHSTEVELAKAREQGAAARAQVDALERQLEELRHARGEMDLKLESAHQQLRAADTALAQARERAAVEIARAEILAKQLDLHQAKVKAHDEPPPGSQTPQA